MTKRHSDEGLEDQGAARPTQSVRDEQDVVRPVGRHFRTERPEAAEQAEATGSEYVEPATEEPVAPAPEEPAEKGGAPESGPDDAPATDSAPDRPAGPPAVDLGQPETEWPSLDEVPRHSHHKHSRRRARRRRRLKVLGIVMLVLVLVAGGAALGVWYLVSSGEQAVRESSQAEDLETADEAETEDEGYTVEYNGTTYRYNENIVSIVVMGYDRTEDVEDTGEAGQADAVMVVAFDTETGEMNVIGIPRDTMVYVDEMVGDAFVGQGEMQLALAFSYGDGYETSAENVVRAVRRILYNMPMNYYVALNLEGVGAVNDAVGGVTLTAIETIPNTVIVEGEEITLWGSNAQKYVQYRDTSQLDSSLQRQARQSQYLQAFFSQAISSTAGNPSVLVSLYQTALEYATTNLGVQEFTYLATVLLQNGMSELNVTTLAGEAVKGDQYVEYHLDEESVYQTVLDVFYTPVEDADTDASTETTDDAAATDDATDMTSE